MRAWSLPPSDPIETWLLVKIVGATHVVANVAILNTVNPLREARRRLVTAIESDAGATRPDLRER